METVIENSRGEAAEVAEDAASLGASPSAATADNRSPSKVNFEEVSNEQAANFDSHILYFPYPSPP